MDIDVRQVDAQALMTLTPMVLGIVAVITHTDRVASEWKPAVSLVVGIVAALLYAVLPPWFWGVIAAGIVAGLSASGLWSGVGALRDATTKKGRTR